MLPVIILLLLSCILSRNQAQCVQSRIKCASQLQKKACESFEDFCQWIPTGRRSGACSAKKKDDGTKPIPIDVFDCNKRRDVINCIPPVQHGKFFGAYTLYNMCEWRPMDIVDSIQLEMQIASRQHAEKNKVYQKNIKSAGDDKIGTIKKHETLEIFDSDFTIEGYMYIELDETKDHGLGLNIESIIKSTKASDTQFGEGKGAEKDISMTLPTVKRMGDKRTRVELDPRDKTKAPPAFENIGKIEMKDEVGRMSGCTGTRISHNIVFTAAHCLMSLRDVANNRDIVPHDLRGGLYKNIKDFRFYSRVNGGNPNQNRGFQAKKFFVPRGYIKSYYESEKDERLYPSYDYAFVLLELPTAFDGSEEVWNEIGYYGFKYATDEHLKSGVKVTAGYPGDLNRRDKGNGYFMYKSPIHITRVEDYWFEDYARQCAKGQSGSPLLEWDSEKKQMVITGVLSQENKNEKWYQNAFGILRVTTGIKITRITKFRYHMMQALVKKYRVKKYR